MTDRRPNILCFITDQQRADHLGCYGNPDVKTPHIDRLANEGTLFTEAYAANPVCMPNRATLFTGRYPKAHGLRENGHTLPPSETTLPGILREHGYATASFGKIHLAPTGITKDKASSEHELYESREYWETHDSMPLPYYGLEHVYLGDGHGHYAFGSYKRDLDREHPGVYRQLQKENALKTPTGTRESWKASIPDELHYNTAIADKTIEYLKNRDKNKPFFIWCSFPDPHHPFSPPAPWCNMYKPKKLKFKPPFRDNEFDDLPPYFRKCFEGKQRVGGLSGDISKMTEEQYREILAHTYGMISMVDANIGRILETLESLNLMDDTVITFQSDHADLMGDHRLINKGPFLFRNLVRVPTIWRIPGKTNRNTTANALVSSVDFCPTMLELAGMEQPAGTQGRSYADVLNSGKDKARKFVYIEYDESYLNDRLRQIRSKEWALTYYANNDYGLLYDLKNDPNELRNLWDDKEHTEIKERLLLKLLKYTSAADDWLPGKKCHA